MNVALTSMTRSVLILSSYLKKLLASSSASSHSQASPGAFGLLVGNRPDSR